MLIIGVNGISIASYSIISKKWQDLFSCLNNTPGMFAIPLVKKWSLFARLLSLGWLCDFFDQQNVVEVMLVPNINIFLCLRRKSWKAFFLFRPWHGRESPFTSSADH